MVKICEVVDGCEDCPKYGDDCDGDKMTEHTDLISRADALNLNCVITVRRADTKGRKCDDEIIRACFEAYAEHIKKLPSADAVPIHEDGTLEVKVPNAQKVGRVLVMDTDSHIGGGLFYPDDAEQGKWVDVENEPYCECSVCGSYIDNLDDDYAFCPRCGARMKGGAE